MLIKHVFDRLLVYLQRFYLVGKNTSWKACKSFVASFEALGCIYEP